MQRRHRLSRSRDFDAVYRQGRSVSTRFLVLYWFPRDDGGDEPRLGLAVPKASGSAVVRNRIKRQLREAWRSSLSEVQPGRDYVLIVRPGLAEASEQRGFEWLTERIGEVLAESGGVKYLGIGLVYVWRYTLGALLPQGQCKYHPSCSQYAIDAMREHGLFIGAAKAGWRLLRCNPWSKGGVDYA